MLTGDFVIRNGRVVLELKGSVVSETVALVDLSNGQSHTRHTRTRRENQSIPNHWDLVMLHNRNGMLVSVFVHFLIHGSGNFSNVVDSENLIIVASWETEQGIIRRMTKTSEKIFAE
jgi:hypothetical protein